MNVENEIGNSGHSITLSARYFEDRRPVPGREMIAQGTRPADLARRMNMRPQEVNRLTDLHHPTKIDTIAQALKSLGKRLTLSLV